MLLGVLFGGGCLVGKVEVNVYLRVCALLSDCRGFDSGIKKCVLL